MPTSGSSPETPSSQTPAPASATGHRTVSVRLRTAPKIWPFLAAGAVVGALIAFVVTWISHADLVAASEDGTTEHSFASTFGFMFMIFAIVCMALAGLIFLLVDRIGRRRMRTVDMVVEPVTDEGEDTAPVKE
ncbi:MAG: hypothetical protein ACTIJJ_13450 [Galactobacter sp.]